MEILVIDIETTEKVSAIGHIVEIGAVILNTESFVITPLMDQIIKETDAFNQHAWIFGHSTLTAQEVMDKGVGLDNIRGILQAAFNKYLTVAYNSKFDFRFLRDRKFEIKKLAPDPMYIMCDVMKMPGYQGYKWPSCQECLNYFKIVETEPHRAVGDAMLEARLIAEMIKKGIYPLDSSLMMADTNEMKIIRFQAKIESYDHIITWINEKKDFCQKKIAELKFAT